MKQSRAYFIVTALIVSMVLGGVVRTVFAHEVTEVGAYALTAAWEIEPVIVGERNTIVIDIMRDNRPIPKEEARLNIVMESEGEERPIAAAPLDSGTTLRYKITFIPTAVGEYLLHLNGTLGDDALEVTISPEPVNRADILEFPAITLSNRDLQDGLFSIEDQLAVAQQRANIGMGIGLVGVLTGIVAVVMGRKKSSTVA